jgi:hypothetical protein
MTFLRCELGMRGCVLGAESPVSQTPQAVNETGDAEPKPAILA